MPTPQTPPPKVAIVYDRLNSAGGAEKILAAFQELYPTAPFFSSVYDKEGTPWLLPETRVHTSWLQHIPGAKTHHQWFGWLMPLLFESFSLAEYDVIISVSSEAAKGVLTRPEQLHINYVLTPTRYLWSHQKTYQRQVPRWLRPVMQRVVKVLKAWDRSAAQRPDIMVPISRLVQERVKKYYRREVSEPIYPPVSLTKKTATPTNANDLPITFFFTWGRHVPYKQFDRVIRAGVRAKLPVVIAGDGPDTNRLRQLAERLDPAHEYVFFVGRVSEPELRWYLERSQATIFPQLEDFGIVILESLLAGCPVITHHQSGAAELMTDQDGIFLTEDSTQILVDAMQKIQATAWERLDIQRRARHYAGVRFSQEWSRFVESAWEKHYQALHQKSERNL